MMKTSHVTNNTATTSADTGDIFGGMTFSTGNETTNNIVTAPAPPRTNNFDMFSDMNVQSSSGGRSVTDGVPMTTPVRIIYTKLYIHTTFIHKYIQ